MRPSFIVAITSLLMTACTPNSDSSQTAVKVEIARTAQGYTLLRGGEPYAVNGAGMAANDIERFAAHGGNSVRTWSTGSDPQETLAWLDDAHEHGVTVAMGLSMGKERHGFDYDDKDAVAEQLERVREEVLRYKDHPAVLLWIIGNELDHRYTNPAVWDAVNDVAEMIHDVDPYHPATTTTAGFHPAVNEAILDRAPTLDFISFQLYGSIFGLEDNLKAQAFEHPFMITEWGAIGWWEMEKTDWDVPFETTSSQKADIFLRAYQEVIEPLESQI
ncbi:MAG: glycoside hydrolase family 2 TIM barrel-domain containing protein, partial [Pseudomonadota bacterium]